MDHLQPTRLVPALPAYFQPEICYPKPGDHAGSMQRLSIYPTGARQGSPFSLVKKIAVETTKLMSELGNSPKPLFKRVSCKGIRPVKSSLVEGTNLRVRSLSTSHPAPCIASQRYKVPVPYREVYYSVPIHSGVMSSW